MLPVLTHSFPTRRSSGLAGVVADEAEPVETVADAARGAEVAAILAERGADVGRGAVAVVGRCLDDQRDAAGAIALVADLLVIIAFAARRLVDRAQIGRAHV